MLLNLAFVLLFWFAISFAALGVCVFARTIHDLTTTRRNRHRRLEVYNWEIRPLLREAFGEHHGDVISLQEARQRRGAA